MRRLAFALAVACAPLPAAAQTYTPPSEPPRATDAATVLRSVTAREVHERFRLGLDAEARGDWNAAREQFTRVVALDPPEPRGSTARYDLALAQAHLGNDADAMRLLDEAQQADPGFAAAAANLIAVALHASDLPRARAAALRLLSIAPSSALGRYGAGLAALRAGDYDAARASFRALLGADPAYAVAHYDLGLVEVKRGDLAAAERELRVAVALSPAYARARFALGGVLLRLGRRDEARSELQRCASDAADPQLRALADDLRSEIR